MGFQFGCRIRRGGCGIFWMRSHGCVKLEMSFEGALILPDYRFGEPRRGTLFPVIRANGSLSEAPDSRGQLDRKRRRWKTHPAWRSRFGEMKSVSRRGKKKPRSRGDTTWAEIPPWDMRKHRSIAIGCPTDAVCGRLAVLRTARRADDKIYRPHRIITFGNFADYFWNAEWLEFAAWEKISKVSEDSLTWRIRNVDSMEEGSSLMKCPIAAKRDQKSQHWISVAAVAHREGCPTITIFNAIKCKEAV